MLSSFINSINTNLLITEYFIDTNMNVTTAYCWSSFEWAGSIDLCWHTIHAISLRKHRVCRTHMSILTGRVTSRGWLLRQSPVLQFWCLRNYQKYNNEVTLIVRTRTPSLSISSLLLQKINFNDSGCIVQNESVYGQLRFLPIHVNKKQSTFPGPQSVHILKRKRKIQGAAKVRVQL